MRIEERLMWARRYATLSTRERATLKRPVWDTYLKPSAGDSDPPNHFTAT